jgi:hypothetical protein
MWTLKTKVLGSATRLTVEDSNGSVVRRYYSTNPEMIEATAQQWAWLFGIKR